MRVKLPNGEAIIEAVDLLINNKVKEGFPFWVKPLDLLLTGCYYFVNVYLLVRLVGYVFFR